MVKKRRKKNFVAHDIAATCLLYCQMIHHLKFKRTGANAWLPRPLTKHNSTLRRLAHCYRLVVQKQKN